MFNFIICQGNIIKPIMRYYCIATRMAKILKLTISSLDKVVKQLVVSCYFGECKLVQPPFGSIF